MDKLEKEAISIAKEHKFNIDKKVYQAFYYSSNNLRNIIYSGIFGGKRSVLKLYNDPRFTLEPKNQEIFNKNNKSKILIAPEVYKYKIESIHKGWLIMEEVPKKSKNFKSPITKEEREEFINLYIEYRKNFPYKPTRDLSLVENLNANKFNLFRINRWLELANNNDYDKEKVLDYKKFIRLFNKATEIIDKDFKGRKMIWCHGHFKPKEIFKVNKKLYYLTDFGHTHLFPEGSELTFMIWADYFMEADWNLNYGQWSRGVIDWIEDLYILAQKLKIKKYKSLLRASLIERTLGAILGDVLAFNRPQKEKYARIKLLTKLLEEIIG